MGEKPTITTKDWSPIAEDHAEIRERIQGVRAAMKAEPFERETAVGHVEALFEQLREHFRREERDEYFGAAFLDDPKIRGRIDRLILQHHELLASLKVILADLRSMPEEGQDLHSLGQELESFFDTVHWHDAVEAGLMHSLGRSES